MAWASCWNSTKIVPKQRSEHHAKQTDLLLQNTRCHLRDERAYRHTPPRQQRPLAPRQGTLPSLQSTTTPARNPERTSAPFPTSHTWHKRASVTRRNAQAAAREWRETHDTSSSSPSSSAWSTCTEILTHKMGRNCTHRDTYMAKQEVFRGGFVVERLGAAAGRRGRGGAWRGCRGNAHP